MHFSHGTELMEYYHMESTWWAVISHSGSNQLLEWTPVLVKKLSQTKDAEGCSYLLSEGFVNTKWTNDENISKESMSTVFPHTTQESEKFKNHKLPPQRIVLEFSLTEKDNMVQHN